MPHTLTFFIKKPFWAYFVLESIFFVKCDDDIFVKRRTFTFCKMSHFSKNVNHVLFEMSYLFNQLLDYKMKYINEKTKRNAIDMYHLLFQNFYKCKYIYINSTEQFQKQWHFQCWSQYIYRSIQSIWKVRLRIERSNKELPKCPMLYHHWASTLQDIAAATLTFCKISIFCWRHFLKTSSINVFPKCS